MSSTLLPWVTSSSFMNGQQSRSKSIRDRLGDAQDCAGRFLHGDKASVSLGDLLTGDSLWGGREKLAGRSVLVLTGDDQLTAALAIIQLDGIASRLILAP